MDWLLWLLLGLILGWLIELAIDYLFWQRRCDALNAELNRLQGSLGALEARALAAERDTKSARAKLTESNLSLTQAQSDLAGAHAIHETLRNNVQILEDRVDNWGRKIGLLASAGGLLGPVGVAFSQDGDDDLRNQIDILHQTLDGLLPDASGERDPLQEINGIGAVYEKRLNDAGIFTFQQLIESSVQQIHEIISPKDWQVIDSEDWLAQAREILKTRSGI